MNLHDVPRCATGTPADWYETIRGSIDSFGLNRTPPAPAYFVHPYQERYWQELRDFGGPVRDAYVGDQLQAGVNYRFRGERPAVDINSLIAEVRHFADLVRRDPVLQRHAIFAVSDAEQQALFDWAGGVRVGYDDPLTYPAFNRATGHMRLFGVEIVRRGR